MIYVRSSDPWADPYSDTNSGPYGDQGAVTHSDQSNESWLLWWSKW